MSLADAEIPSAGSLREDGNDAFKKGDLLKAIEKYSK
jgi:hypothetical protein